MHTIELIANVFSEMEPYESQRYNEGYYSHSAPRYMRTRNPNYYNCPPPTHVPQQYYEEHGMPAPPPLPPNKPKKKSMLKSPLTAIKNALIKTTRPLRRMNSMVEPERRPKSALKRQHSMLERGMQRPYYPDEYPTYPAGFEERYAQQRYHGDNMHDVMTREQYYREQLPQNYPRGDYVTTQELLNSTYQNLEGEDIYSNMSTVARAPHGVYATEPYNGYERDDLYANRALIDLERRQAEAMAGRNGRRIVRRHSTTTADRAAIGGRRVPPLNTGSGSGSGSGSGCDAQAHAREQIYQSKEGAYMLEAQRRAPNSEVLSRRHFYPGAANELPEPVYQTRREMQRHHLQQSKREMQQRIQQGKREMEREFSSHSSSQSERDDRSERDAAIYQTRREIKERTQLREQIYQTRREALDSMAEPRRDICRPEPIYETKEESILQSRENETDEKKKKEEEEETKTEVVIEINHDEETLSRSDLQQSSDTIIEQTVLQGPSVGKAPIVQGEDDDDDMKVEAIETTMQLNQAMLEENSDDVFVATPQQDNTLSAAESIEPLKPPQAPCAPFHISNVLKHTAPPPPTPAPTTIRTTTLSTTTTPPTTSSMSQTSINSQVSLPVGPPNASSTPYPSNMSLPIAGPVPTSAPAAVASHGPFPALPREPKTTRGVFDASGGTLADPLWNVSLQIPAGAIPAGTRQEIYFTVSDPRLGEAVGGPPLDMENGLSFV